MFRPTYIVFAGVNGAGKSTFFHSDYWLESGFTHSMPRVNSDEILLGFGGDPGSQSDQLRAAKIAYKMIESNFKRSISFNQETTLTGKTSLRNIKRAHNLGYRVILYYIGVSSPEVSMSRISHRVELGGHNIDDDTVLKRYRESLQNFSNAIDFCDEVIVFDNSLQFCAVARWSKGVISWVGQIFDRAPWLVEVMHDDSIWRV